MVEAIPSITHEQEDPQPEPTTDSHESTKPEISRTGIGNPSGERNQENSKYDDGIVNYLIGGIGIEAQRRGKEECVLEEGSEDVIGEIPVDPSIPTNSHDGSAPEGFSGRRDEISGIEVGVRVEPLKRMSRPDTIS